MLCAADPGYWEQWGLLTLLIAAGTTVGAAAIVTTGNVASPSQ
jgi:hypothetical protein